MGGGHSCLRMGTSQTLQGHGHNIAWHSMAGAWHRGGWGEIVLIRKLPPASATHPSPPKAGQSRSTAEVSAGSLINWSPARVKAIVLL